MGICPVAAGQTVETFPQLTEETDWAALHHVPVGRNVISVKHERNNETALTNEQGPALAWRAAFPGTFRALLSKGREVLSNRGLRTGGGVETYGVVQVEPGETLVVRAASG